MLYMLQQAARSALPLLVCSKSLLYESLHTQYCGRRLNSRSHQIFRCNSARTRDTALFLKYSCPRYREKIQVTVGHSTMCVKTHRAPVSSHLPVLFFFPACRARAAAAAGQVKIQCYSSRDVIIYYTKYIIQAIYNSPFFPRRTQWCPSMIRSFTIACM